MLVALSWLVLHAALAEEPALPEVKDVEFTARPAPAFPVEGRGIDEEVACEAWLRVARDGSVQPLEVDGCPAPFAAATRTALTGWQATWAFDDVAEGADAVRTKVIVRFRQDAPQLIVHDPPVLDPTSGRTAWTAYVVAAAGSLVGVLQLTVMARERRTQVTGLLVLVTAGCLGAAAWLSPAGSDAVRRLTWATIAVMGVEDVFERFGQVRLGGRIEAVRAFVAALWVAAFGFLAIVGW